jgi:hypothetical protein
LAHEHPPDEIRSDPSLRIEFPPAAMVELFEAGHPQGVTVLHWYSPEMIARDKAFFEFRRLRDSGASMEDARRLSGYS